MRQGPCAVMDRRAQLACHPVFGYLKRLVGTGAAYQAADVVAKVIALGLLPVYTRHLSEADYGTAELLLTLVILLSIIVRAGVGEALVRFHFHEGGLDHRLRVARTTTAFVLATSTLVAGAIAIAAEPLSEALLGFHDATVLRIAALGLWSFTNLEVAYALLRVEERWKPYLVASLTNVALTVGLTVWLVVFEDAGARGLLAGNFAASTVVLFGVWWTLRDRLALVPDRRQLPPMLRFGLPTVPAEVSVFALNVIDRLWLYRLDSEAAAGLYSLAIKLAAVVVFTVRAFQYAWPPLAYSISDDREASRVYATITTYYVLVTGLIVAAITLLGRWVIRLFAAPAFFDAHEALPWVALGWALYGLFLVLVVMAGRAGVTTRNFPAALAGLVANVALLALLVGPLGIAGAGVALCGAYVVMLVVMYLLTRRLFVVAFEWRRLAQLVLVIGGIAVAGELLLPTDGVVGFAARLLAALAILPVLRVTRFFDPAELRRAQMIVRAGLGRLRTTDREPPPR
jgi:O-antigen/teichoic acid export membrane protein